eukprot:256213_1
MYMSNVANEWKRKLADSFETEKLGTTENFYDTWSPDYDECVNQWGYAAPMKCASLMRKYLGNKERLNILDVGVGTGLVGQEIIKYKPFKSATIVGIDISNEQLNVTQRKSVYSKLTQWDFAKTPYPFPDNAFDAVVCIGVLTYCKNFSEVFNEWIRITKPGALIIASHRSGMMKKDKTYFDGMIATLKWKKLEHRTNEPYLPNNTNYAKIMVDYYVARNTKKPATSKL